MEDRIMRSEVEMIYYEDDISSHEQFVELLFKLRKLTKYITIVQIDGEKKNDPMITKAMEKMTLLDKYNALEWYGTLRLSHCGTVYEFDVKDKSFFSDLMEYEAFYIPATSRDGEYRPEYTSFGLNDIAFLDRDKGPLFFTTTHEGFSVIHPDVLDVDISWLNKVYF